VIIPPLDSIPGCRQETLTDVEPLDMQFTFSGPPVGAMAIEYGTDNVYEYNTFMALSPFLSSYECDLYYIRIFIRVCKL
jgi:hypothetical protein